jgi:hypothetical protein
LNDLSHAKQQACIKHVATALRPWPCSRLVLIKPAVACADNMPGRRYDVEPARSRSETVIQRHAGHRACWRSPCGPAGGDVGCSRARQALLRLFPERGRVSSQRRNEAPW